MMSSRPILATISFFGIMAVPAHGTELEFCTESVYAPGDVCPAAQPSSGSGTCYSLTVKAGTCCEHRLLVVPNLPVKGPTIGNISRAVALVERCLVHRYCLPT